MSRLEKDREILIRYFDLCRRNEDWHGCRDAATDIEVLEARIASLDTPEKDK